MNKQILSWLLIINALHGLRAEAVLERVVNVQFTKLPAHEALAQLAQQGQFDLAYNTRIIPPDKQITLKASACTVRETLYKMLGTAYEYKEKGNSLVIKKAKAPEKELIGYLKNPQTGERIAGATVYDQKTLRATTTDANGYYRLKTEGEATLVINRLAYRDTTLFVHSMSPRFIELDLIAVAPDTAKRPDDLKMQLLRAEYRLRRFFAAQLNEFHALNVRSDIDRNWQVSLLPRIGTNHTLDAKVSNQLSINLIAGQSREVRVVEMGGFGNFTEENVRGVQFGGAFNINKGNTAGVQVAGAFNTTNKHFKGVQVSGAISIAREGTKGSTQVSGLTSIVKEGSVFLQVSGVSSHADMLNGVQVSSVLNTAKHVNGVQIGVFNSTKTCNCVQIGLINRVGKRWFPVVNMGRRRT